jgi:dihydrofolate reductase
LHSGALAEVLKIVKAKTEKHVWLVGGGQLAQSFLKESLIDKIVLSTIPIILGDGISLFGNSLKEVYLTLLETRVYETGILQAHYVPSVGKR